MRAVTVKYLGRKGYSETLELQRSIFSRLLAAKGIKSLDSVVESVSAELSDRTGFFGSEKSNEARGQAEQVLLFVEHPHVYTLGKSGRSENLLVNEPFLSSLGAELFRTDRGGDITYHGPGQLVGYPILDLERFEIGLKEYVFRVEEAVIRTIAEYGITGSRLPGASGVWVCSDGVDRKICAVGVRSSHFVTMHGFALNVSTDLGYFTHINPCGFVDRGVTSIEQQTGLKTTLQEVAGRYQAHFATLFGVDRMIG